MNLRIRNVCITSVYLLIYLSAAVYMVFLLTENGALKLCYNILMIGVIGISIIYALLEISVKQSLSLRFLPVLLFILVLFELIVSAVNGLFRIPVIFTDAAGWPAVLLLFWDYTRKYDLPKCFPKITAAGVSAVFLISVPNIIDHLLHVNGGAVFATYYCFAFLPLVFYALKKKTAAIMSGIAALLMLATAKRAAFIIIVLGLAFYALLKALGEEVPRRRRQRMISFFLLLLAVIIAGEILIQALNLNILDRISGMLDDGGSGRVKIWQQVFGEFSSSSAAGKWFGHGFHSVYYNIQPLGIQRYAHNSFLEILYDYGIIGVSMLLLLTFWIIGGTVRAIRKRSKNAPILGYCLVPMLILALVSYFFEESILIVPFSVIWGICFGSEQRTRSSENSSETEVTAI